MGYNLISVLFAIGLTACSGGPKRIDVSGTAKDLRFTAVAPEGGSPACVEKVSVAPITPEEAEPYWQVVSTDPTKCISTVRYGMPTDDFAESSPAVSLTAEVVYRVRVSGAGFSEVRDFRITADKVINQV